MVQQYSLPLASPKCSMTMKTVMTKKDTSWVSLNFRIHGTGYTTIRASNILLACHLLSTLLFGTTIGQPVYLFIGNRANNITTNGTEITINEIGEDGSFPTVSCHTDLLSCCRASDTGGIGVGDWFYPSGDAVPKQIAGEDFYRVRNAPQVVRLARREGVFSVTGPTGLFCCSVPTTAGNMTLCINIVVCPSLPRPEHGMIVYSDTNQNVGTEASLSCDPGFSPTTTESRVCRNDGSWSGNAFVCAEACLDLDEPQNGNILYSSGSRDSRPVGSIATYSCDGSSRNCLLGRIWSQSTPGCSIVICSDVPMIANGNITYSDGSSNNRSRGTVVNYTCVLGYELIGMNVRTCQVDRTWSGSEPSCRAVTCPDLTAPINGGVVYSSGTNNSRPISSQATHHCDAGYTLSGDKNRTCTITGSWNGSTPLCLETTCPDLPSPLNGVVTFSAGDVNSRPIDGTATYNCNTGYLLEGVNTSTCQIDGRWSESTPYCSVIICSDVPMVANGDITYSDGSSNNRSLGTIVNYTCVLGYELIGMNVRTCQADRTWSGSEPSCRAVTCPDLTAPINTEVVYSSGTNNSRPISSQATYHCDAGYTLSGDKSRTCTITGLWNGSTPLCLETTCPDLLSPLNGVVTFSAGDVNSRPINGTATYSCNTGYLLEGVNTSTCQIDGRWSESTQYCSVIICSDVPMVANGDITYSDGSSNNRSLGTIVNYTCVLGYELIGMNVRTCQADRTWSGSEPSCRAVTCPDLMAPINTEVVYSSGTNNSRPISSQATYHCDAGYTLSGDKSRTCTITGLWSGSTPLCLETTCPDLLSPLNGVVTFSAGDVNSRPINGTATYSCNTGYLLEGVNTSTCQIDGRWSESTPYCSATTCGFPDNITNGKVHVAATTYLSTASYVCEQGYNLVGLAARVCEADGMWSPRPPICEPDWGNLLSQAVTVDNHDTLTGLISSFASDTLDDTSLQNANTLQLMSNVFEGFANLVNSSDFIIRPEAVENTVSTLNTLMQWMPGTIVRESSSSILKSHETVVSMIAQQRSLNFSFSEITLVAELAKTSALKEEGVLANFTETTDITASILLPSELFERIPDNQNLTGFFYALFEDSSLFPITSNQNEESSTKMTFVTTPVISATVGSSMTFQEINPPVKIQLEMNAIDWPYNSTFYEGEARCVSWDFLSMSWVSDGCTTLRNGSTIQCLCTHLTNFAVLIDVCSRAQDCETNVTVETILSAITYIGVVFSCFGLFITAITLLAFREVRSRDNTMYTVQLCIAIFCLLVIFAAGIERTEPYAGCVLVSVLIHYFSLAAVMWMGAEAMLMFQKLVIVFSDITTSHQIIVSLICWLLPVIPVLVTLIIEVVNGTDLDSDLIITRYESGSHSGFCFLKHNGVFFGTFLGPILAIILFNIVIFICVIVIVIKSTKSKLKRTNEKLTPKRAIQIGLSLFGVMILFGLTWIFAALTFTISESDILRYIFQALFVVFASFQGFVIFLCFCILDHKVRRAWKGLFVKTQTDVYSVSNSQFFLRSTTAKKDLSPVSLKNSIKLSESNELQEKDIEKDFELQ